MRRKPKTVGGLTAEHLGTVVEVGNIPPFTLELVAHGYGGFTQLYGYDWPVSLKSETPVKLHRKET